MIDYETFCRLRQLRDEQGLKISQIAAQLGLDPKTVANWIERDTYQQRQGRRRPSMLDPFKDRIKSLLVLKRFFWSLVLLVPVIGWIFYGGLYRSPPVQPKDLRAQETTGVY